MFRYYFASPPFETTSDGGRTQMDRNTVWVFDTSHQISTQPKLDASAQPVDDSTRVGHSITSPAREYVLRFAELTFVHRLSSRRGVDAVAP